MTRGNDIDAMTDGKVTDHIKAARTALNDVKEAVERIDAEIEAMEDTVND